MGCVDLSDQMKVTFEVVRRSKFRLYLRVFFEFLDIAVINSKNVYSKTESVDLHSTFDRVLHCTNYDTEVFKQKKSSSAIQAIEEVKRSII